MDLLGIAMELAVEGMTHTLVFSFFNILKETFLLVQLEALFMLPPSLCH